MEREVAIVHFNTPELTEAAILSLRKHGGVTWHVTIFDNSDERPFTKAMTGVTVIDNTKGQVIDFDKELEKYPERDAEYGCAKGCVYGSDKHMMSVQKLWEIINAPFLLMDSDILIKDNVEFMFQENQCAVGHVTMGSGLVPRERLAPYLLFINVPLCVERGARFFDPERSWALHKGDDERNFWDTGAALLDDIRSHKNGLCGLGIDIRPLMVHLGSGSWEKNKDAIHRRWLGGYRYLWDGVEMVAGRDRPSYTVLTYIFGGYERVQEVWEKDAEAEYVLVTDDPNLRSETWTVVHDETMKGWPVMEKCYYVRFHPFQWAHTDTVVRIDGSIEMRKPLGELMQAFNDGGYDRCMMIHPTRNTFDKELEVWVKERHYKREVADRCLRMMKAFGYKVSTTKGMFQGCFEIVRNSEVNNEVNRLTYHLMKYTGGEEIDRLDQHITSFVINTVFKEMKILAVGEELVTDGRWMQWMAHGSKNALGVKRDKIKAMMRNKAVTVWEPGCCDTATCTTKKKGAVTVPKSAPSATGGGVAGDEIAGYGKEAGDAAEAAIGDGAAAAIGDGAEAASVAQHSKPERMKRGSRKGK